MSRRSKRGIKILNPSEDGSPYTSHRSAARLVERGRADWISKTEILLRAVCAIAPVAVDNRHSPTFEIRWWAPRPLEAFELSTDVHQAYPPWPSDEEVRDTKRRMARLAA